MPPGGARQRTAARTRRAIVRRGSMDVRPLLVRALLTTAATAAAAASIAHGQGASSTPDIPGVVASSTPIELVQEGFAFTEGTVGTKDGGLFFTDTQGKPTRIFRLDPGRDAVRPLGETQGMNGLAIDAAGRLFGAEMFAKRIVRLDA